MNDRTADQAIAFQGKLGAYSHLACIEGYPQARPLPCESFDDTFEAVRRGDAGMAMIPIENSVAGRVADIHHLLPESGLHIVAEHFQRVNHCLLAPKGATIEGLVRVHSHVHALPQCRELIRELDLDPIVHVDTAREAVEPDPDDGPTMTTFVFRVRNVPAALYKVMGGFATNNVNMVKLESYMLDGTFTATQFYADIEGHPKQGPVRLALEELDFFSRYVKILGVYPAHPFRHQN